MLSVNDTTMIECTIKEILSNPKGFAPADGFTRTLIINDFANYIPKVWKQTNFSANLPQGFINYALNTPNISKQYASLLVGTLPG